MSIKKPTVRDLRAQSHALKPIVRLGNKGLTEAVHAEIDAALNSHELIKVKIVADRDDRPALIEALVKQSRATLVNAIGQVCVLYRKKHEE